MAYCNLGIYDSSGNAITKLKAGTVYKLKVKMTSGNCTAAPHVGWLIKFQSIDIKAGSPTKGQWVTVRSASTDSTGLASVSHAFNVKGKSKLRAYCSGCTITTSDEIPFTVNGGLDTNTIIMIVVGLAILYYIFEM